MGKKHVDIDNLINKGRKAKFSVLKMQQKSKEKTAGTYLKLFDSIVKSIILYACGCWGNPLKNDTFANKIEKFYLELLK